MLWHNKSRLIFISKLGNCFVTRVLITANDANNSLTYLITRQQHNIVYNVHVLQLLKLLLTK